MKSMLFFEKIACFMQERIPVFGKQMGLIGVIAFSILMCGMKSEAATLYWPVPGHTSLSQGYHNGNAIDISDGSIAGANVVAAMGGKVTHIYLCGTQHLGQTSDCNGFGTGLVIAGDDGRIYQYAHMQANSIPGSVYYGAYVNAGQQIGKVGTTGNSSGNHLHFGISLGNYWNASGINPQNETYQGKTVHTHSYSSSVTTQPTCTATGVRTYRCSCGASYTESIAAKGHSYKSQVVAPTFTEKGYTLHTCSACGNCYKDNYVNPPEQNSDGWYYSSSLPSGVTSDKYTIEYNNYYEKIQATSPGTGWTNVATVKNEWQNSGGTYTSENDLPTSDSRVLVRSIYYHFCGPNAGTYSNYEQTGNFVHYDEIDVSKYGVIPYYKGLDNGHPWYFLDWNDGGGRVYCQSGVTCDGAYGTHGERNCTWYKLNTYQDRVKVVQYKFTKNSGWVAAKDASATSVKVRFKAIKEEPGEITNPEEPGKEEPQEPGKDNPEESEKEDSEETDNDMDSTEQEVEEKEPSVKTPKPKKVTKLYVKNKKNQKLSITWKKQKNVVGYQVQIAMKKNFEKGKKTKTVFNSKMSWSGLKKGKTYYVRVRGYNYDHGKKQYGSWSAVKRVMVRK